jgi:hypothetical protein
MLLTNTLKTQSIQLYKYISNQTFDKRQSEDWIYFQMREIKHQLFIDISVVSTNNKEDSPYPKFSHKNKYSQIPRTSRSTVGLQKNLQNTDSPNLDSVVGKDMNLAKQISIEDFGLITKATPLGFHTVQISEDKQGFTV